MLNLKDDNFDERDVKLTKAILEGVKNLIKDAIKPIKIGQEKIVTALKHSGIYVENVTQSNSPKQITETGT